MRSLLALLVPVALGLVGCGQSRMVERPENESVDRVVTQRWVSEVRTSARSGDWLLSRSYAAFADVIVVGTSGEELSHAAMYDAETDTVIESIGSGVREVSLESFLTRNHEVMVVRPRGFSEAEQLVALERARSKIGAPYDVSGLFGIDDPDKFYCSELVYWASDLEERMGADETVITPAELAAMGEIRYRTGGRDAAHRRHHAAI